MFYLLFIFYGVLFCWLITRIRFFNTSGLSNKTLLVLFFIRILSLLVGSYINLYVLPVSDSVTFHNMGIEEFNLLFQNPHQYFVNFFHNSYESGYSRVFNDYHSYWNNLRTILIAKMLSVFDIFSFKNFWINTLFFNFLIFFGCVALYKVFIHLFPKCFYQLIFCIFLLPSALFFSAMIHRDGLIFLSISMIIYHLYFLLKPTGFSWRRILVITLFLMLIFLVRNFVFIAIIPALIAWIIAYQFPKHALLSFFIVYFITGILFFCSGFISSKTNLPQFVSERQKSFIEIGKMGNSTIPLKTLSTNFKSYMTNAPQAFTHVLMRPYLLKIKYWQFLPFAFEIFLIEILFLFFIFYHKKKIVVNPVIYFCLFLSMVAMLEIGYTVPIIGSIVRYRSIYLIFLLIPIFCYMDWPKILNQFKNKKITPKN